MPLADPGTPLAGVFSRAGGERKGAHRKTAYSASMAALTMGQLFLASLGPIRFQKIIKV
jgi:hypothetical protein